MFVLPFLVGFIGFLTMVALGALRGGHGGGHGGGHAGGHGSSHLPGHTGHGVGHHLALKGGQVRALRSTQNAGPVNSLASAVFSTLSPINVFSLALGFGATGIIFKELVPYPLIIFLAIAGALLFNFGMVKPMMNWFAGFATKPSEGIEGTVFQEAEAITGFDKEGRGIVQLTLDGQHVQLLATLDLLEVEKGIRVNRGEKLIVTEVDSVRNSCRVTRELAL